MDVRKITDDKILEYLCGEFSLEDQKEWDETIATNHIFQQRVKQLTDISREIKNAPALNIEKKGVGFFSLARQFTFAAALFAGGAWFEANFSVYSEHLENKKESLIHSSKDLSWNESNINSLM